MRPCRRGGVDVIPRLRQSGQGSKLFEREGVSSQFQNLGARTFTGFLDKPKGTMHNDDYVWPRISQMPEWTWVLLDTSVTRRVPMRNSGRLLARVSKARLNSIWRNAMRWTVVRHLRQRTLASQESSSSQSKRAGYSPAPRAPHPVLKTPGAMQTGGFLTR